MELKYPHLFSPLRVKNKVLKNRIITGPSNHCLQGNENYPTEQSMVYYAMKAKGGAALVLPGSVRVDRGLYDPRATQQKIWNQFNLYDRYAWRYFKQNTDIIHHFGALAGIEFHQMPFGGYEAADMSWRTVFAVSRQEGPDGLIAEEMPEYEMERLAGDYADLAALAKMVGYDYVLIHMGHGMQLAQFLSPRANKRIDKYGGSPENRERFPLMILEKVREKVGDDLLLDLRVSADEGVGEGPGFDIDDCIHFLERAQKYVDFVHISSGDSHNPLNMLRNDKSYFGEDIPYAKYATAVKKSGRIHVPVLSVTGYDDPADGERMLAEGNCDGIVIARGLIADPNMPNKAKAGQSGDIRPCLYCNNCLDEHRTHHFFSCTVNPHIGREHHFPYIISPTTEPKKVVVVGGGPGGMQAAITAAERGHRVTLVEQRDRLGGAMTVSENFPLKRHMKKYLEYMVRQVKKMGVQVVLNTRATPEYLSGLGADSIISAIGAEPVVPPIPGIRSNRVITALEAFEHTDKVGQKTVIIGGGDVGCETGIYLGRQGHQVTIIEISPVLAPEAFKNIRRSLIHAVTSVAEVKLGCTCTGVSDTGVTCVDAEGMELALEADTVILAAGMKARLDESETFRACAFDFRAAGDCREARNIKWAVREGFDAAVQL